MQQKAEKKDLSWIGSATSLLAVAACYGTLAAVSLLSLIGINLEIEESVMVKLVSALLVIALAGMAYSFSRHRRPGPLMLSLAAAALLLWVFFAAYSRPLEMLGFALLILASIWDFIAKKRARSSTCNQA
ncbi:MAG TPA: MerC domain-containing protein [Mariprofundaceae bacterium]|nr:MerC domain-containing protein [Mariprofundaceae bacterium]